MNEKKNKDSIIPALSNNSHELFHSNLWQWLLRIDKKFVKCFFNKCNINHNLEIDRETENMDLRIIDKDAQKQYIIENKLKSIPNDEQLNNYKEKQDKKENLESKYLLVYSIKNNEIKAEGWDSIDYIKLTKKIMKKLGRVKDKNKIVKKYYSFLKEYCEYIIEEFKKIKKSKYMKKNNYYFGKDDIDETHIDWGLKVIYQKMKAEKFKCKLDEKININLFNKKFEKKDCSLMSVLGYNHGKPCFTYRIQYKYWRGKRTELGKHAAMEIQLEGNQYRHMVRLIKDDKDKAEKINEDRQKVYYKRALEVFNKTDFLSISENEKGNEFTKYDMQTNIAIYKYRKIDEEIGDKPSVEDVAKHIKKDLNKIMRYVGKEKIRRFLQER